MNPIETTHSHKRKLGKYVKLLAPVIGIAAGATAVQAQPDYGPAIWNPAYPGHWYTSGNGHRFAVCHDMEGYYLSTISYFKQSGTQASSHYCVNGKKDSGTDAPEGEITQMVREAYYAWHVGCWNTWMFGTEHEGFASNPAWYTEAMYDASAGLQRHLCDAYGITKDRNHVIGHNEWQNGAWVNWMHANYPSINTSCNSHSDPGPYWNWNHEMAMINNVVMGAILGHYNALGGAGSFLGEPVTSETSTPDGVGRFNHFQGGSIYWTPSTGAWSVRGAIRDHWAALGWETGPLGYPTTDENTTPDGVGKYNHFNKNGTLGSIYWTSALGAHEVHGDIRAHWAALGWETGPLGYPTTDESTTPDGIGRYNHFNKDGTLGSIYWTPSLGAHEVHGAIRDKWSSLSWENSVLGYPSTDESTTPDGVGRYNHFDKNGAAGSIYWTPSTGAHEVHGPIRTFWANQGWENGPLGYPTSDEYTVSPGIERNDFEHGTITYNTATGQVTSP